MKLKLVTVDLELSRRTKRALGLGLGLALLVGGGAVAYAGGLHSWKTGDALNADDLNNNFGNLETRLAAVEATVHPASAFHATADLAQGIPTTVDTTVVFDQVEFDSANEYNKVTGGFSPAHAGVYALSCTTQYQAIHTTDWYVTIRKNGADLVGQYLSPGVPASVSANVITQLAAGDTITCAAWQNSGGSIPLLADGTRNSFSGARLY